MAAAAAKTQLDTGQTGAATDGDGGAARVAAGAEHNDGEEDDDVAPTVKKKHKKKRGKSRKGQHIRRRNTETGDM